MNKSWITEIGFVCAAVGGALLAGAQVPNIEFTISSYMTLGGTILGAFGTSLIGYRISKKIGDQTTEMKKEVETKP